MKDVFAANTLFLWKLMHFVNFVNIFSIFSGFLYKILQFGLLIIKILQNCPVVEYTLENTEGQSKMDNPEKLATYGTQDEEKQNKNTQYVLDITIRKQTQIT